MREIKFQALVVKHALRNLGSNMQGIDSYEEIIDVHDISFDNGKIDYVTDKDGDEYSFADKSLKAVRQYTGLKDQNDKEIYEGDIIHCVHWFFNGDEIEEHFTASVGFRDGSFTLENIKSRYYSDFTGEENGKGICWIGEINYCEEDYEVIGNIYQNPELLKTESE
ncbi:YopX family protein [Bacillus sp. FSL W7-1085]|uniref:YopX family protein n=1 Tax=Bacillus sp. FSL W7-1085 TaxID=2921694 RepID=UPI00315ACBA7